jgi:hypothetical protein
LRTTLLRIEVLQRTYFSQPEVLEQKTLETLTRGLEDLVQKQLILDDFKTQGGALPEAIIDDEVRDRIRQKFAGDRATFTRTFAGAGRHARTVPAAHPRRDDRGLHAPEEHFAGVDHFPDQD